MKDIEKISEFINEISIPRRCGSPGEKQTREFILEKYREASKTIEIYKKKSISPDENIPEEAENDDSSGNEKKNANNKPSPEFEIDEDEFSFPSDSGRIMFGVPALALMALLFLNISFLIFPLSWEAYRFGLFLTPLAIIIFLIIGTRWNSLLERLTKRTCKSMIKTANLVARISGGHKKTLVFTAHYDSKSSGFNFLWRFILSAFVGLGSALVALYTLSFAVFLYNNPGVFQRLFLLKTNMAVSVVSLLIMVVLVVLYSSRQGNESPGADDNATGVAVLLTLLQHFVENPPDDLNLWFVADSAEEEGLVGIVRFIDKYENQLDKKNTYIVNLDSLGGDGKIGIYDNRRIPFIQSCEKLPRKLAEVAKEKQIPVSVRWIPPAVFFDSMPPADRGYKAITISHSSFDKKLKAIHSQKDTPDHLNLENITRAYRLCRDVVPRISGKNFIEQS